MHKQLVTGLIVSIELIGWVSPVHAELFSASCPIIAILADKLFVGKAEKHLGKPVTITLQSRAKPDIACLGQLANSTAEPGDSGQMQCSDGATATFQFQRLSTFRGYGAGNFSHGSISFTFGLSAEESKPYLKLPAGKQLKSDGKQLELVDTQHTHPATVTPDVAPDALFNKQASPSAMAGNSPE